MKSAAEIESLFSGLGADFLVSGDELQRRLRRIRAFVFDWDGVFNRGEKGAGASSTFSESDSMGTNLLRYAWWRVNAAVPICAIVSGAANETAKQFAQREHFHSVHCGVADKRQAVDSIAGAHALKMHEIAYVFDDANDFSVAQDCGLRFLVRSDAKPLLREFAATNDLVDYVTAAQSGGNPVREVAELVLGMLGVWAEVFASRQHYDQQYRDYFRARQAVETGMFDAG